MKCVVQFASNNQNFILTRSTQNIEDEACQHEGQHWSVITEVSISELLCSLSDDRHLHLSQRNLLQQSHHLRLLVSQFHLMGIPNTQR